ncbi:GspE/PulE family protein [Polynucleobacter paneuropaeus]|uniref:GspE/PulE family protein n=1 Tax=Polynucleobacter paneuropaeus TaxID=2527775 RepID=UPI000DBF16E3|nr:GspE/PulE family protein [Polynucleobacter paneuropaeus]AWW43928.1 type II/IV secretion system protein [Polynucleobacter paneuropaeus]
MSQFEDDSFIIRAWHEITVTALQSKASDIHIEASSEETVVRLRIDGALQHLVSHPNSLHERLITRIKILARLDIAERRLPQDGRLCIGIDFSKPDVDCRVSTMPTLHGEKAVVRILPSLIEELSLDRVGLLPEQLAIFRSAIHQPHGLILVTGPTGSGKTRTLYSCLRELNQPEKNLCSIEDPIEIRLPGINQVSFHEKAGLDFATIIRALLRQDPDVLMIGEIRDSASARVVIEAAQTGHLVLSTLHTRNARGAIARLKTLGIEQEHIESCLHCVSSQRLVKAYCQKCKGRTLDSDCSKCKGSGYFGRIGVHEVLNHRMIFSQDICSLNMHSAGMHYVRQGLINPDLLTHEIGSYC